MKKIKSLFKRNYGGDRLVYDEVVLGSEWVPAGEGWATVKYDGTACMIQGDKLYKRYDRKLTKSARKRHFNREGQRTTEGGIPLSDFKPAPPSWQACEVKPDSHTGHWPGWVPIGSGPEDRWFREVDPTVQNSGTYELVGPKVGGNPYGLPNHQLWLHGMEVIDAPRSFEELKEFFVLNEIEGIVWWRDEDENCDKVKIKRADWGLPWPPDRSEPNL